jgi:2-methylcitrate dehydratase PrpD
MSEPSVSGALVAGLRKRLADGVPAEVLDHTRDQVVDSVGIAIAAAHTSDLAAAVGRAVGPPATAWPGLYLGTRDDDALANGALIHMLDYDDIYDAGHTHLSAVTLPAALCAAAESGASVRAVLAAVALGNEVMCRLGDVAAWASSTSDWFLTQVFGYFGAAVAYGVLAGLSDDELTSALGLAYLQAAGGKEAAFGIGGTARAIYPGFAARGGVTACRLARAGIVGPARVFEGAAGLHKIYLGTPLDDAGAAWLTGDGWQVLGARVKQWPCCRISHPYVRAALLARPSVTGKARVVVRTDARSKPLCEPLAQRCRPATLQDAKYSVPFLVALALVRGEVSLATVDGPVLADDEVREVAAGLAFEPLAGDALVVVDGVGHGAPDRFDEGDPHDVVATKFRTNIGVAGGSQDAADALLAGLATDDADFRSVLAG